MRFTGFAHMLTYWAEASPEAPALLFDDGGRRALTFRQLSDAVSRRRDALRAEGKTCVGVLSDGSADCVITVFSAVLAGMQVVLLDEAMPDALLSRLIAATDVDTLFGDAELTAALAPCLTRGVADGGGRLLFFTSGTTEVAKAVVLTDGSLMASAYSGAAMLPLSPGDVLLNLLPLGHVFGFVCGLLWGLSCGACVALGRGARHYLDDPAYFAPTALPAVPALLGFLLRHGALNDGLRLVLVGAGGCPEALLDAARAKGLRVSFGYGLTETSSGVAISTGGDPFAMDICPDDTVTLAPDGEVLVTAPTCMMQGYYRQPEATAAVLQNGVLYTGDLGRFDENGRLHIVGRKKDMLVLPDGTKVLCAAYEAALSKLLGTAELCVAEKNGRPVLALYAEGLDEAAVLRIIKPFQSELARSQQIAAVFLLDKPLPRTATGKIQRWHIQQEVDKA